MGNNPVNFVDPWGLATLKCATDPKSVLRCWFEKDPPVPGWLKEASCVGSSVVCPAASRHEKFLFMPIEGSIIEN